MKETITSFSTRAAMTLAVMLCCLTGARAEELTVYDGTDESSYFPVFGYYANVQGTASEFVIPSDELINMAGGAISGLKFYTHSPAGAAWTGTFKVYLKEIAGTTLTSFTGPDACSVVYTGTLDATGSVMTVTFANPYTYEGGNLLIGTCVSTAGNDNSASFYGCDQSNNTARHRSGTSDGGKWRFIPKTTFTYTPDDDKKPSALIVSDLTSNTATLSWTTPTGGGTVTGYAYQYKRTTEENWSAEVEVNTTSVTISELRAATGYRFRVKAVYDSSESYYISTTFHTDCEINTFPWTEDFEGFDADCWQNEHITGSGTYNFEVISGTNGSNSTQQLCLPDMPDGTKTKFRLPVMSLPGSNYMFTLDVYRNNEYNDKTAEGVRVFASADGNIQGATELAFIPRVRSVSNSVIPAESADGWYTYKLRIPMSGTCYIILQGESKNGSATYMDNFALKEAPPVLTVSNITKDGADFSWTACDNVTEYTLQVASDDLFTDEGGSLQTVTLVSNEATSPTAPTDWTYNIGNSSGSYLNLFSGHYVITEAFDASNYSNLSLSLDMRTFGGNTYREVTVQYSTDNGVTWNNFDETLIAVSSDMHNNSLSISKVDGEASVRLRIASTSTSSTVGVGIKNIVISGTEFTEGSIRFTSTFTDTSCHLDCLYSGKTLFARVKGNGDWSDVVVFSTLIDPSWTVFPATTVNVGESVEMTISDYVSGTPAPTITLTSTTANDGEYEFANGVLTFNPTAVGTYTFSFNAENSEGDADATLTVTSIVTVPELTVNDFTNTTAAVSWTECDGVTSYTLQLSSDEQFTTGGSGGTLTETFANVFFTTTSSSYTDQTISDGDLGTWTATSCRGDQGSPVIRYAGPLTSPTIANGVAAVEFDYDWPYSKSGSCDIELYVGGTLKGTKSVTGGTAGTATYTLDSPVPGPTTIEFRNTASSNKRMRVTEVRITTPSNGSSGGSLIAEETVTGTSYTFTGLTPETIYYARVKGNTGWSNVVTFTTPTTTLTALEEGSSVASLISEWQGKQVEVSFTRSFTSGVASTVCLPFPMDKIEGGKVYEFRDVTYDANDGWVATMQDATPGPGNEVTTTTANNPYLFMPTKTGNVIFMGTIASVPDEITAGTTTSSDWTFQGTYSKLTYGTDPFSGKAFGFAASATAAGANNNQDQDAVEAGEFVRAISGAYIPAFRAFLTYSGSEAALQARTRGGADVPDRITVRLIGKNGEIDGIGEIRLNTGEVTFDSNAWYDLNGRKLDGKPTQKGIYINGGHKVAIK